MCAALCVDPASGKIKSHLLLSDRGLARILSLRTIERERGLFVLLYPPLRSCGVSNFHSHLSVAGKICFVNREQNCWCQGSYLDVVPSPSCPHHLIRNEVRRGGSLMDHSTPSVVTTTSPRGSDGNSSQKESDDGAARSRLHTSGSCILYMTPIPERLRDFFRYVCGSQAKTAQSLTGC